MGISQASLPDHFLEKLFPEDRKQIQAQTTKEAFAKWARGEEKAMHAHFSNWLGLRQIPFVESWMHKRSSIAQGHPDFTVLFNGLSLCVEFKVAKGRLTEQQQKRIDELRRSGNRVVVCHSFSEAINVTKQHFEL